MDTDPKETPEVDQEVAEHFDHLEPDSIIECPECRLYFEAHLWRSTEVGCEDCGSHPAIAHDDCYVDMIMNTPKVLHNLGPSKGELQ